VDTQSIRRRSGFTLAEVLVAMTIMLAILGMTTHLFRSQNTALATQAGRLDAQQTGRFSLASLDRELRVAGIGVVDAQPVLVQAARLAITFNSDLVSRTKHDPSAVYIDTDVDTGATGVFRHAAAIALPTSAATYPESTYMRAAGVPSGAETISFWLAPDSSSAYANEYVLYRRVNAGSARVIARGIVVTPSDTVFQYFKGDTAGVLTPIPTSALPLIHSAKVHGSLTDSGKFALIDTIRTVRVRMTTVYHDPKGDVFRRVESTIRLMNAGLIHRTMCGDPPTQPIAVTAIPTAASRGNPSPYVTVAWTRALDEASGEKDVERYAIYRRLTSQTAFDEPLASIPAGSATYAFVDTDVVAGQTWVYGIASQDCTPNSSSIVPAGTVTIP
jgi:prepilin-type N-terminal cleavage/methylation domain-containing protein